MEFHEVVGGFIAAVVRASVRKVNQAVTSFGLPAASDDWASLDPAVPTRLGLSVT